MTQVARPSKDFCLGKPMKTKKQDLKKLGRLQKRSDFLWVNANAKKWIGKNMIVLCADNQAGLIRYGITVTKKLEKTAVGRNRMKRRLRAIAAEGLSCLPVSGKDYVVVARAGVLTKPYDELLREFSWCVEKMDHARP
jgi:ribonuclease P protein component